MAPVEAVVGEDRLVASRSDGFMVTLVSASPVPDPSGGGRVYLIPDAGGTQIATLHDALYGGALSRANHAQRAYVPHITIAAGRDD